MIDEQLPRIWQAHNLGNIQTIIHPKGGSINYCLMVNDAYVIRFDTTGKFPLRFQSEALAYRYLHNSGVPVPDVIVFDPSKELVPYEYLITTKLQGAPIIDSWNDLSESVQKQLAHEAGRYLALIHTHTFERFGKLRDLANGGFTYWYDYCADYFHRYAQLALDLNAIDTVLYDRLQAVLDAYRPLLDAVTKGSLLHSDYHFENILQHHGTISGIIDFEWAYSGDSCVDLVVDDVWERMCPGSKPFVYAGYSSITPLDANSTLKTLLYKLYSYLETLVSSIQRGDKQQFAEVDGKIQSALQVLENGG